MNELWIVVVSVIVVWRVVVLVLWLNSPHYLPDTDDDWWV